MLACSDVTVKLDRTTVLTEVSLQANAGEVLGLLGPNGAGKSTLLRALAGILPRESGSVMLDDADVDELNREERARRIAYLPQSSEVHWPLSVYSLVALGRLPHRRVFASLDEADDAAIERAMIETEIQDLRERSIGTLSGGERMRVLIARMLSVNADVLLVDEPIAGLDPYYQIQFMDLFRRQAAEGRVVLLVLHDLASAARFCDRLVLLDAGRIAASGDPEVVLSDDALSTVYRVEAIRGTHEDGRFILPWRRI